MKMVLQQLKNNRLKLTPQRMAIVEFLQQTKEHPSAEDVFVEISKKYKTISFATVYNTLSALKSSGSLSELTIDPEKKRFDMDMRPHHHFFCRVCKGIYDVCADIPMRDGFKITEAHKVENVSLSFTGICNRCNK